MLVRMNLSLLTNKFPDDDEGRAEKGFRTLFIVITCIETVRILSVLHHFLGLIAGLLNGILMAIGVVHQYYGLNNLSIASFSLVANCILLFCTLGMVLVVEFHLQKLKSEKEMNVASLAEELKIVK